MDEKFLEIAAKIEENQRQAGINAVRQRQADSYPKWDGETCLDCGDDLHPVRIDMGCVFCVPCQELRDKKLKIRRA